MPHNKSTKKRVKTNEIRRQRNVARRSRMRHAVRDLREVLRTSQGKLDETQREQLSRVQSLLDRMVTKGVVHRNKAARLKSRLERQGTSDS